MQLLISPARALYLSGLRIWTLSSKKEKSSYFEAFTLRQEDIHLQPHTQSQALYAEIGCWLHCSDFPKVKQKVSKVNSSSAEVQLTGQAKMRKAFLHSTWQFKKHKTWKCTKSWSLQILKIQMCYNCNIKKEKKKKKKGLDLEIKKI